jgi:hypothetical protein
VYIWNILSTTTISRCCNALCKSDHTVYSLPNKLWLWRKRRHHSIKTMLHREEEQQHSIILSLWSQSYVARRNKTESIISGWLNANRTDAMTGFIFHSTTIKSSSCGIFHKDRYYNNTAPLFSCNISMQPRSECSYRLTVITKMPSLLACSALQGWRNRILWQNLSRREFSSNFSELMYNSKHINNEVNLLDHGVYV